MLFVPCINVCVYCLKQNNCLDGEKIENKLYLNKEKNKRKWISQLTKHFIRKDSSVFYQQNSWETNHKKLEVAKTQIYWKSYMDSS